jgi:hypothetical protein
LDPLLSSYEEISLVITDNWLSGFVEAKGCFGISLDPGPAAAYVCSCRGLPNLGINLLISSDRSLSVPIGAVLQMVLMPGFYVRKVSTGGQSACRTDGPKVLHQRLNVELHFLLT